MNFPFFKIVYGRQKSNKILMTRTITGETKREGERKAKRPTVHKNPKKGRELVPLEG